MIPHHHLIAGPVEGEVACYGRNRFDVRRYRTRFDTCDCLSHRMARPWYQVTGDSYIIHAEGVGTPGDAGRYMAKYLTKTFGMESRLEVLGMTRRWSTSRGWPGGGRMRLAIKDWDMIMALPGSRVLSESGSEGALEREGEDLTRAFGERGKRRRYVAAVKEIVRID